MSTTTALVLCGGRGTRWHAPTPKHLAPIGREPLLARTVRMLRARGVSEVALVTEDPRIPALDGTWRIPIGGSSLVDAIHRSRASVREHTVVLCGDVCFSAAALDLVATHDGTTRYLGRWGGRPGAARRPGYCGHQIFGLWLGAEPSLPAELARHAGPMAAPAPGAPPRGGSLWHLYCAQHGSTRGPAFVHLDDEDATDDFDSLDEHEAWLARWWPHGQEGP